MDCPTLNDWSIVQGFKVYGTISNSKTIPNNTDITTTRIIDIYYSTFYTIIISESNEIYKLGRVSDVYIKWIKDNNIEWDPLKPISIARN